MLKRTFGFDVLACPRCDGRMRLLAMVTEPKSVTRYLRWLGEPCRLDVRANETVRRGGVQYALCEPRSFA